MLIITGCAYLLIEKISNTNSNSGPGYSVQLITTKTNSQYSTKAATGKNLFMSKCASCHQVLKNTTGPALAGFEERGPWIDRKNVYEWIKNPTSFMAKNKYTQELKKAYGSMMTAFPDLTNEEIDAIIEYLNNTSKQKNVPIAFN